MLKIFSIIFADVLPSWFKKTNNLAVFASYFIRFYCQTERKTTLTRLDLKARKLLQTLFLKSMRSVVIWYIPDQRMSRNIVCNRELKLSNRLNGMLKTITVLQEILHVSTNCLKSFLLSPFVTLLLFLNLWLYFGVV